MPTGAENHLRSRGARRGARGSTDAPRASFPQHLTRLPAMTPTLPPAFAQPPHRPPSSNRASRTSPPAAIRIHTSAPSHARASPLRCAPRRHIDRHHGHRHDPIAHQSVPSGVAAALLRPPGRGMNRAETACPKLQGGDVPSSGMRGLIPTACCCGSSNRRQGQASGPARAWLDPTVRSFS